MKWLAFALLGILVVLVIFLKVRCDSLLPHLTPPVERATVDLSKPIIEIPLKVTYTDKKGVKHSVSKPIEGTVKIVNDKLTIQEAGFCLIPKTGWNSTNRWYAGVRFFYWDSFGLEAMANDQRAFLGVDYRLPILNMITIAGGGQTSFQQFGLGVYCGTSISLAL